MARWRQEPGGGGAGDLKLVAPRAKSKVWRYLASTRTRRAVSCSGKRFAMHMHGQIAYSGNTSSLSYHLEKSHRRVLQVRKKQHGTDARGFAAFSAEAPDPAQPGGAKAAGRGRAHGHEPQAAEYRRRHGPHLRGPLPGLHRRRAHVQGAAEGRRTLRAAGQVLPARPSPSAMAPCGKRCSRSWRGRRLVRRLHRPVAQPDPEPHLRGSCRHTSWAAAPEAGGEATASKTFEVLEEKRGETITRVLPEKRSSSGASMGLRRHHGPRQGPGAGLLAARHPNCTCRASATFARPSARPSGCPSWARCWAAAPAGGLPPTTVDPWPWRCSREAEAADASALQLVRATAWPGGGSSRRCAAAPQSSSLPSPGSCWRTPTTTT